MSGRRSRAATLALAGAFLLAAAPLRAQLKEPSRPGPKTLPPSLDKVTMESFVTEPATIPAGATQVTLKVTVKNVTNSTGDSGFVLNGQKIRITRTNPPPDVLELETTIVNLAPGATQTVGARVNIGPGIREYFARVDPDDTLHEPIIQRANNEKRMKVTVPQVSGDQSAPPGSAPRKETQLLDYDKAKRSGAQFLISSEGASACLTKQRDVNAIPSSGKPAAGAEFELDCSYTGARANVEAFASFHLKSGWKVKSYDAFQVGNSGNADWQWTRTPAIGSDDPSSRIHMWADPVSIIAIDVKVEIEGPAGTNPYQ